LVVILRHSLRSEEDVIAVVPVYPVSVEGTLDDGLSRWLWLVKWFLLIPHFIVLIVLWTASGILTFVAFFAILFTGRYPRGIFDFNVGVLRWTWRVNYYGYNALATDKYPPFSLSDRDYPANLEIEYPERLSRGLVLIKWVLAIPQLLVVAILTNGQKTGGLVGLLAIIAAVVLPFTGRYPKEIFELVLGFNRWNIRVAAYVALMRDEYPPFRLSP
jgi:hypothetical protein